jgi:hypothetical protein
VRVWGTPPAPRSLDLSGDPDCAGQPASRDEQVLTGSDGGVANAMVRIVRGARSSPAPSQPVELVLRGCGYRPRILVAWAGQPVLIRNEDHILHAVRGFEEARTVFTGSLAPGTPPLEPTGPRVGEVVKIGCDVHPWMTAYLAGVDNPYFAVTGEDGLFTLQGVPAGTYTVEVWHEKFRSQRREVVVGPASSARVDFTLGLEPSYPIDSSKCRFCESTRGDDPVAKACLDGGIKRAKSVMKAMQKVGKERGLKFECDDCHRDESAGNWTLNRGAWEKYDKLLALQEPSADGRARQEVRSAAISR